MRVRFVLGSEQPPERVDKVLSSRSRDVSRGTLQRWIREGRVRIDGQPCKPRDVVGPGQVIEVEPGPAPLSTLTPDPTVPFEVVFEDEHLVVVNKPAGVVVHPAKGHRDGTLVAGLLARGGFERVTADAEDPEGHLRPGIVHRIDKGTSGLLVAARTEPARIGLKAQLAAHVMERRYRAITIGIPSEGRIETRYGRHPRSRLKFTTSVSSARRAVTHVSVGEALGGRRAAVVWCRLETGRTHQIRVHLSEVAGTPLLGDRLYGGRPGDAEIAAIGRRLSRQALHAEVLGFTHPVTGERLRFEAPLPEDLRVALESLRALSSSVRSD